MKITIKSYRISPYRTPEVDGEVEVVEFEALKDANYIQIGDIVVSRGELKRALEIL